MLHPEKAVPFDNADVCRTSALSEEKRLAAQTADRWCHGPVVSVAEAGAGLSYAGQKPQLYLQESFSDCVLPRNSVRCCLVWSMFLMNRLRVCTPSDMALYDALENLRDAGNSVFVVEHDLNLMRRAQWLVDVGPSAGEQGGHVLYSGIPEDLKAVTQSRTARYLFDEGPATTVTPVSHPGG